MKYDIITFGSATEDIFIKSKVFLPVSGKTFPTGRGICLPLGAKIEVKDMIFASGGGGTNTAATFAKQGFKVAWSGMVGDDQEGRKIIEELRRLKVDLSFVRKNKKKLTNHSIFLCSPGLDRTVLVYRGASDELRKKDIPWEKIKNTEWFYLAPFSGKLSRLTDNLIDFAAKHKIKVALNPGYNQLRFKKKFLGKILAKVDILLLNQEEASVLTGIPYNKEGKIFRKIDKLVRGVAIMTKGEKGAVVSDGKYLYHAPILKTRVISRTGAGDSFGAGFVSGLLQGMNIEKALRLAIANAAACLGKWGAKEGLLKRGQKYQKVQIVKTKCKEETNICHVKFNDF